MTGIDDVDYRILELLMDDARRSYRDIAEEVGRSPPTVSERVERLTEVGVIERFTLDVDRSRLVRRAGSVTAGTVTRALAVLREMFDE